MNMVLNTQRRWKVALYLIERTSDLLAAHKQLVQII